MIPLLKTIGIIVALLLGGGSLLLQKVNQQENLKLGAIQTIELTDSVKNALYTKVNANFAQTANTTTPNTFTGLQQFTNASTSLFSCYGLCYFGGTATSSFSTAGALTLITPLLTASGGTGSTTISSNQVILGNGASGFKTVTGWGTTNQILTSQGVGAAPTWTTTLSLTTDNEWTGKNGFGTTTSASNPLSVQGNVSISGTTTTANLVLASSTLSNSNGTNVMFPSGLGTISSVLSYYRNFAVNTSATTNASTTLSTLLLPANTLRANSVMTIDTAWSSNDTGTGCRFDIRLGSGTASSTLGVFRAATADLLAPAYGGHTQVFVISTTQQYASSVFTSHNDRNNAYGAATAVSRTTTGTLYLDWIGYAESGDTTCTLQGYSIRIDGN